MQVFEITEDFQKKIDAMSEQRSDRVYSILESFRKIIVNYVDNHVQTPVGAKNNVMEKKRLAAVEAVGYVHTISELDLFSNKQRQQEVCHARTQLIALLLEVGFSKRNIIYYVKKRRKVQYMTIAKCIKDHFKGMSTQGRYYEMYMEVQNRYFELTNINKDVAS